MVLRAIPLIALTGFLVGGVTLGEDEPKLPGSEMKVEDAALNYGDVIFSGEVKGVSSPTLLAPSQPGASSYEVDVRVLKQFTSEVPAHMQITVFTYDIDRPNDYRENLFESPPKIGTSYIFFGSESYDKLTFTALKVLRATDESISLLSKILTDALGSPMEGRWFKLTGSYLKVETAISKSDAVFIGEVIVQGFEVPQPTDASYAGPLLKGIKFKISKMIRGSIGDGISLSMFVMTTRHEELNVVRQPYIFFVQTKGEKALDYPYNCLEKADTDTIVIKLLRATDDNIAIVKKLIAQLPAK